MGENERLQRELHAAKDGHTREVDSLREERGALASENARLLSEIEGVRQAHAGVEEENARLGNELQTVKEQCE
eukprot:46642-Eustigmatos_ZCMA.PRE.1